MTRIVVKKSKLSWGDLVAATIEGEVTNVRTEPRVALTVEADDRPLGPVLENIKTFRLAELSPKKQQAAGPRPPQTPVEIIRRRVRLQRADRRAREAASRDERRLRRTSQGRGRQVGDLASIGALNAEFKGQGVALAWMGLFPGPESP